MQASRRKLAKKTICTAVCAVLLTGCATNPHTGEPSFKETFASDDPCSNNARNIGIAAGAIAGAIIGNQFKHSNSARIGGALLGATVGGLIGKDMDARRCALATIARQYDLDLKISTVDATGAVLDDAALQASGNAARIKEGALGSSVEVRDPGAGGGHFESDSDQLTQRAEQYFSAIADSYNARTMAGHLREPQAKAEYIAQIAKRKILLIGHTDDTGNSRLNADLAERRARAVSAYMQKRGIPKESLYFQGAGESYPAADNTTDAGRARNRRVEIVEIADAASFDRYLAARKPRYDFYRAGERAPAVQAAVRDDSAAQRGATGGAAAKAPLLAASKKATGQPQAQRAQPALAAAPKRPAPAPATAQPDGIDFGGVPLQQSAALTDVGQSEQKAGYFSLISSAYASEPAVITDCTRDRPRAAHGVKALADGKTYRTSEHLPGLYGKTWTDRVNGHQIVLNKVAVLAGDGSLASPPEFKVYANYQPGKNANPAPDLSMTPDVNTYLGSKGLLYRLFLGGRGGMQCVDIVFSNDGGASAKAGKLVYNHAARAYAADFKPRIYQK